MFEYYNFDKLKPGKQNLCCIKMAYCQSPTNIESQNEKVPVIDIYVKCYIVKINNDTLMLTFCDNNMLKFSNIFYVYIYNKRNLPAVYELPLSYALSNNILTINENGTIVFIKNNEDKILKSTDIFNEKNNYINRLDYIKLCENNHCDFI